MNNSISPTKTSDHEKLLSVKNLSRQIGDVAALSGVTFDLYAGQVLGVVGLVSSGKSTLLQLIGGEFLPSSGEIYLSGKRVFLKTPMHAGQYGIEIVHQKPQIDDNLDTLRNIFLGREIFAFRGLGIWPKRNAMARIASDLFARFDLPPELIYVPASNLTDEQRQIVTLARAFVRPARLLLLDDPLAALSYQRQAILIDYIKELASQGAAVIISSDDLKHIFSVTDRILVLYNGNQVAMPRTEDTMPREVVELIVGINRQEQVTPVIWAFENYHAAQKQAEELRQTQTELRQNLQEQDSLNRQLVIRLREQVIALDRLNLALQEANRRLMTEREAERKSLARDLHDQVIQDLLSYSYQLEGAEDDATDKNLQKELGKIRQGMRQVVSSLRQLCSDLRPPTLDSQGLPAAIHSLIHQWSEQSGVHVSLSLDPDLGRMPELIELSVFRIIQEGLNNVRKHAHASEVQLTVLRAPAASLVVKMSDNGKGMSEPVNLAKLSESKHFGLLGISERVSLLGGTMKVNTSKNGGLELLIEIPSPYPSIDSSAR